MLTSLALTRNPSSRGHGLQRAACGVLKRSGQLRGVLEIAVRIRRSLEDQEALERIEMRWSSLSFDSFHQVKASPPYINGVQPMSSDFLSLHIEIKFSNASGERPSVIPPRERARVYGSRVRGFISPRFLREVAFAWKR